MGIKNLLPMHKKDDSSSEPRPSTEHHHHHHHHERTNGHVPVRHKTPKQHKYISNKWRNELVAAAAEFCGTFMFLFFAFGGTQVANSAAIYSDQATAGQQNDSITQAPNASVLLYISLIFGFSLMVNVWVFFRVSGGLFNPAVSHCDDARLLME
jgi:aquaporin related protein